MYCTPCLYSTLWPCLHASIHFYLGYPFHIVFDSSDLLLLSQHSKESLFILDSLFKNSSLFAPGLSLTPCIHLVLELLYLKSHVKFHPSILNTHFPQRIGHLSISEFKVKLINWPENRHGKAKEPINCINVVRYRKAYYKSSVYSNFCISHILRNPFPFPCISMWPGHLIIVINKLLIIVFFRRFTSYSDCSELQSNSQHEVTLRIENKVYLWTKTLSAHR